MILDRKTLYITSYRENIVADFSEMLRNLGRRFKRPVWGKALTNPTEAEAILYLDSGGRGNLSTLIKSMRADLVEFVFFNSETGKRHYLITEVLKSEQKGEDFYYKSEEKANKTLEKRIKIIDEKKSGTSFYAVEEAFFERSTVTSSRKSAVKRNITYGSFEEGSTKRLFDKENFPDVVICDSFTKSGALVIMESFFGRPGVIHAMNEAGDIYAPVLSVQKEMFVETEEFTKEAFITIGEWLSDSGEELCREKLIEAFTPLERGEELIKRTTERFMRTVHRKKRS